MSSYVFDYWGGSKNGWTMVVMVNSWRKTCTGTGSKGQQSGNLNN